MIVMANDVMPIESFERAREQFPSLQKPVFDVFNQVTLNRFLFELKQVEEHVQKILDGNPEFCPEVANAISDFTCELMEDEKYILTFSDIIYGFTRIRQLNQLNQGLKQGLYREMVTEEGKVWYGLDIAVQSTPSKFKARALKRGGI